MKVHFLLIEERANLLYITIYDAYKKYISSKRTMLANGWEVQDTYVRKQNQRIFRNSP